MLLAPLNCPGGQLEHAAEVTPVAALTSVLPTPQDAQDDEPLPEYSPEPQLSHSDASLAEENLPASHSTQVVLPASLYLPEGQTSHASDSTPVSELTSFLPSGQKAHSLLEPALNEPGEQTLQLLLPDELKVPARQAVHAEASTPVSTLTRRFPATHVEHAAALAPLYLPAEQWPHATNGSAVPESARYLPASHSVQDTEPLPLCWPGGQELQAPAG